MNSEVIHVYKAHRHDVLQLHVFIVRNHKVLVNDISDWLFTAAVEYMSSRKDAMIIVRSDIVLPGITYHLWL